MTITLASINNVPTAVRGGGVGVCPKCGICNDLEWTHLHRRSVCMAGSDYSKPMLDCDCCNGTGTVRYHDLTLRNLRHGPFKSRWVPRPVDYQPTYSMIHGGRIGQKLRDGWQEKALAHREQWLRECLTNTSLIGKGSRLRKQVRAALDAIGPNDILIHDGTDLGARCAEVVKNLAQQRPRAGR